jgi:hypothetical protein
VIVLLAIGVALVFVTQRTSADTVCGTGCTNPLCVPPPQVCPIASVECILLPSGVCAVCAQCCAISDDPNTWPSGDDVWNVCQAIALAEGYNKGGNAAPFRYNNPGDLSKGDEHGQQVTEYVKLGCGETIIHFSTAIGGWQALYAKISNIKNGVSLLYRPTMTWQEIAAKYAGNSSAWVSNVCATLQVQPTDQFQDYFS